MGTMRWTSTKSRSGVQCNAMQQTTWIQRAGRRLSRQDYLLRALRHGA